jgi:hypothetical protein
VSYGYTEDCSAGRDAQSEVRNLRYDLDDVMSRRACDEELWEYVRDLQDQIRDLNVRLSAEGVRHEQ